LVLLSALLGHFEVGLIVGSLDLDYVVWEVILSVGQGLDEFMELWVKGLGVETSQLNTEILERQLKLLKVIHLILLALLLTTQKEQEPQRNKQVNAHKHIRQYPNLNLGLIKKSINRIRTRIRKSNDCFWRLVAESKSNRRFARLFGAEWVAGDIVFGGRYEVVGLVGEVFLTLGLAVGQALLWVLCYYRAEFVYLADRTGEIEVGLPENAGERLGGVLALHVVGGEWAHSCREEEHLVVGGGVDLVWKRNPIRNSERYDRKYAQNQKAARKMVHEVKVNIGSKPKLLMHTIRRLNLTAAGTTGWTWRKLTTDLVALEFGKFLVPVGRLEELVRVERLDGLALEGIEMVGVEEFLSLLGLHCFVEVLGDFEELLVVEGEGHGKGGR
jgi:hypothetical protein